MSARALLLLSATGLVVGAAALAAPVVSVDALAPRSVHALAPGGLVALDEAAASSQLALTASSDRRERLRALGRLGRWPDADTTRAAWAEARESDDVELRVQAAFSEGLAHCRSVTGCLTWAEATLRADEPRLREVAIDLLARRGGEGARQLLIRHVDDDQAVRRRVVRRLSSWVVGASDQARSVRRSKTLPAAPAR